MSLRSLTTMGPWVVSITRVFCGSAPAGSPWAAAGVTGNKAKLASREQTAIKRNMRDSSLGSSFHLKSGPEPVRHRGRHKSRHIAAHAGNLPHQSGADGT